MSYLLAIDRTIVREGGPSYRARTIVREGGPSYRARTIVREGGPSYRARTIVREGGPSYRASVPAVALIPPPLIYSPPASE